MNGIVRTTLWGALLPTLLLCSCGSAEPEHPDAAAIYAAAIEAVLPSSKPESGFEINPTVLRELNLTGELSSGWDPTDLEHTSSAALAEAVGTRPQTRLCTIPEGASFCSGDRFMVLTRITEVLGFAVVRVARIVHLPQYTAVTYLEVHVRPVDGRWAAEPLIYLQFDN